MDMEDLRTAARQVERSDTASYAPTQPDGANSFRRGRHRWGVIIVARGGGMRIIAIIAATADDVES